MNETLATDGVVHLQAALDADGIRLVEDAFAFSIANPSPGAVRFYPNEDATFFEDTGQHHLDVCRKAGIVDVVRDLWDVTDVWYLGEQLFLKEGGSSRRTPWHQDTLFAAGEATAHCSTATRSRRWGPPA